MWLAFLPIDASAHEVRPAYLQVSETAPGVFSVLFKTPAQGGRRLSLNVELSGRLATVGPTTSRSVDGAILQTWRFRAVDPLGGQTLRIAGLEGTMTDALVRVEFLGGASWAYSLTPAAPAAVIPVKPGGWSVASTYFQLGVKHILLGVDHLLFVLGLILIAGTRRQLLAAITAFTVAHSITLAGASLGFVHVSPKPVEAAIALSIAFVALEVVHARQGRLHLASRLPWVVAFAFGLLHGFGFAGALSEIGMPQGYIPLALLFFNLGVEAGQLLFVAAVLGAWAVLSIRKAAWARRAELVPPYLIGCIAMFWFFERVSAF